MPNFKIQVDLISNSNGTYSVDYSIFTPGKRYSEGTITQTQVDTYDSQTQAVPGIVVEILMEDLGPGNPTTVSGSFDVNSSLVLNSAKPFLEVLFKAIEDGTVKYKGGTITRGEQ